MPSAATTEQDRGSRIQRQLFLRTLTLGRRSAGAASHLAEAMREVFFPAGTVMYRAGEAAQAVWFIMKGRVELAKEGEETWKFADRDVVGVLDMMQERRRDRTATAVTDVLALSVQADEWFDALEDNFELTRGAVLTISGRLHGYNLQLAPTGGFAPPPDVADEELAAAPDRRPLNLVERIILLHEVPAFRAASVQSLTVLGRLIEERHFAPGELLFRKGEPTDRITIVVRGLVEITREDPVIRAGFGPGSLVGGYSILGQAIQQYTAHVMVPTTTFEVRHEDYFDLMEDHFEMAKSVLADLGRESEHLMRRIAERKKLAASGSVKMPAVSG